MNKKISLIVFGLNEHEGIKLLKDRINKNAENLEEIFYIDGGSTDGSIELAKFAGWRVHVQSDSKKGMLNGMRYGIENCKGDYLILFSPDNNCIPEKIAEVIEKINQGYDFVKVSRYFKSAKSYDDTLVTSFGNWLFNFLIMIFYGFKTTDALGIYYGLKKTLYKDLKINFDNSAINTELMIKCKIFKVNSIDIEGDEPERIGGETKRSIFYHGLKELLTILKFVPLNFTKKL